MYYYKRTEPNLWTVGAGEGKNWHPDSDHNTPEQAAERVHYLNGGTPLTPAQRAAPLLLNACKAAHRAIVFGPQDWEITLDTLRDAIAQAQRIEEDTP